MSEQAPAYDGQPRDRYHVELDGADAQAVVLSLAICSLDRPGWHDYLRSIASRLASNAAEQFDEFRRLNADRWQQDQPASLVGELAPSPMRQQGNDWLFVDVWGSEWRLEATGDRALPIRISLTRAS